ncbi:MAG: hypothetical protein HQL20_10185 [Candidatus Omnitrophica bacterium]|nr:hypothetical protein [Candidatus Omnitrophota bacterium]
MKIKLLISIICCLIVCGCASVVDVPRNVLGFSRRSLVAHKTNSSFQVYQAPLDEVFQAVALALEKEKYYIFTKDEPGGFISVMNIPGMVDTTEVGVFIARQTDGPGVKVELASRSTPAQRAVAAVLFSKLAEEFRKI